MFYTQKGLKVRLNAEFIKEYLDVDFDTFSCWLEFFETSRALWSMIVFYLLLFFVPNTPIGMCESGAILLLLYILLEGNLYFSPNILDNLVMSSFGWLYSIYLFLWKFFIPPIVAVVLVIVAKNYYVLLAFLLAKALGTVIFFITDRIISKKYNLTMTGLEFYAFKILSYFSNDNIDFKKYIDIYKLRFSDPLQNNT